MRLSSAYARGVDWMRQRRTVRPLCSESLHNHYAAALLFLFSESAD
jgi:hypothetical protein